MLKFSYSTEQKLKCSSFSQNIKDYKLCYDPPLGKGGFSVVYKARYRILNVDVAVKRISKDLVLKRGLKDRVIQEIAIQCELNHPSILKLLTAFEDDFDIYLILELCSNGELMKYRKNDGFTENEVKVIMRQVIDGFMYLHSKLIVHRDIKLSNILLTDEIKIKIADFGLATRLSHLDERHMTMCGTPNYISPEIISGRTHSLEADLWGLGCLLYTLLVGKPPFETETTEGTLNRVRSCSYYIPSFLSESAHDLIRRLLKENPRERIKLNDILKHSFFRESRQQNSKNSDSGFDAGFSRNSNSGSGFHSADRIGMSNNSAGYYSFETPKTAHVRCRSFDRKKLYPACKDEPKIQVIADTVFYPDAVFNQDYNLNKYTISRIQSDEDIRRSDTSTCTKNFDRFYERDRRYDIDCEKLQKPKSWLQNSFENQLRLDNDRRNPTNSDFEFRTTSKTEEPIRTYYEKHSTSDVESEEERMPVKQLSTERLKSTRLKSKNVILTIQEDGFVCVEFLKYSKSRRKELVVEVCRISGDGSKMYVYYINGGGGISSTERPVVLQADADLVLNCARLSRPYRKRYAYAARFVEMVRAKTPKLTAYTARAKCVLMENAPQPDFEALFYDGTKITKSRKGIKLMDNNGIICTLNDTGQDNLSQPLQDQYNYFKKCYDHCRSLEENLERTRTPNFDPSFKVFPAIIGRKPENDVNR